MTEAYCPSFLNSLSFLYNLKEYTLFRENPKPKFASDAATGATICKFSLLSAFAKITTLDPPAEVLAENNKREFEFILETISYAVAAPLD